MASNTFNPINILDTSDADGVGSGGSLNVAGGVSISKNLYIGGGISISGTTTTFADNIIIFNKDPTDSTDTGLLFQRYSNDIEDNKNYAGIIYSENSDSFQFGYVTSDPQRTNVTMHSYLPITTNGLNIIGNSNTLGNIVTTGGNVGINNTSPTYSLDITGDVNITGDFYKDGELFSGTSNWISANSDLLYTSGTVVTSNLETSNLNLGISNKFSGVFIASNNANTPVPITDLVFTDTRSFLIKMSINILVSSGQNLYTLLHIYGNHIDNGWALYTDTFGDSSGIQFSINNEGQLLYTSSNINNFTSSTFRYDVEEINSNTTYTARPPKNNLYIFKTLQITDTTDSIPGTNNGGVYVLGGATIAKRLNVGTSVSSASLYSNSLTADTIVATTYTGGNLSLSGDIKVAGTVTTVNITSSNISVTNFTTVNVVDTNISTGTLNVNNSVTTTSSIGTVVGTTFTGGNLSLSGSVASANMVSTSSSAGTSVATTFTGGSISVSGSIASSSISSNSGTIGSFAATTSSAGTSVATTFTGGSISVSGSIASSSISSNSGTIGSFAATTSSAGTSVATTFTGGSMSLSGSINSAIGKYQTSNGVVGDIIGSYGAFLSIEAYTVGNTAKLPIALNAYGGNVGIGTISPGYTLTVSGDDSTPSDSTGMIAGVARSNSNQLIHMGYSTTNDYGWIESVKKGTNIMPTIIQPRGGNVGIGATAPGDLLHIYKSDVNSNMGAIFQNGSRQYRIGIRGDTSNSFVIQDDTSAQIRLTINTEGNVGIGTVSPTSKLHVNGSIVSTSISSTSGTIGSFVSTTNSSGTAVATTFTGGSISLSGAISGNSVNVTTVNTTRFGSNFDIRNLKPSDTAIGSFRVGFGSWANNNLGPFADVISLNTYADGSGGKQNVIALHKDSIGMRIFQGTFGDTSVFSDYRDVVLAYSNGDINLSGRIGIALPNDVFTYNGKSIGHYALGWHTDVLNGASSAVLSGYGGIMLVSTGVPGLVLTHSTLNVGIGTTSPSYKLDVSGSIRSSSDIYIPYATGLKCYGQTYTNILVSGWAINSLGGDVVSLYTPGGQSGTARINYSSTGVINLNGSVGIGTATPGYKLQVSGGSICAENNVNSDNATLLINNNSGSSASTTLALVNDTGTGSFVIYKNSSTRTAEGGANGATIDNQIGSLRIRCYSSNGGITLATNGNVGIDLSNPTYKLHVGGDTYSNNVRISGNNALYWESWGGGWYMTDGAWMRTVNDKNIWTNNGYICTNTRMGVGTSSPNYPLSVIGSVSSSFDPSFFINGPGIIDPGTSTSTFSAYFDRAIITPEVWGSSDKRIKTNIVDIDDTTSLNILRDLQPKKFSFINNFKENRDLRTNYGFIAQEVEKVLPDAVTNITDFIPSIFEKCSVKVDSERGTTTVTLTSKTIPESWTIGTTIKLISSSEIVSVVKVTNIISEREFNIDECLTDLEYFVYGELVDDFKTLHKEVIFAITTAAVQEIDRQLQRERQKVQDLEDRLVECEKYKLEIDELRSYINELRLK